MFLSRLCGGEEFLKTKDKNLDFLSRLCGGEAILDQFFH